MGNPSYGLLSGIFDRIGGQATLLRFAINSGFSTSQPFYQKVHDNVPWPQGDYQIENALIASATGVDTSTVSGTLFKNVYSSLVQNLENLLITNGANSLDAYLSISGLRVSQSMEDVYYQTRGQHLSAVNVFFPNQNFLVATYTATGSGTGSFSTVLNPGVGGTTAFSPGTFNYGNSKLLLIPIQSLRNPAQVNIQLQFQPQYPGASVATDSVNILMTSGSPTTLVTSGLQFPIVGAFPGSQPGSFSALSGYVGVSNIIVAGASNGDVLDVWAIQERPVTL